MLPGGISSAFSCTLSRCQSTKTLLWKGREAAGKEGPGGDFWSNARAAAEACAIAVQVFAAIQFDWVMKVFETDEHEELIG